MDEGRRNRLVAGVGAAAVLTLVVGGWALASSHQQQLEEMRGEVRSLREEIQALVAPADGEDPEQSGGEAGPEQSEPPRASDGERLNALDVDGVACDGQGADDLQAAFDQAAEEGRVLWIPATDASCRVDGPLWTDDGARIEADPDAVIQALPGFSTDAGDSLLNAVGVHDVAVSGGTWRMLHEGRDVIRILSSTHVTVSDLTAIGGGYDGVYIGRTGPGQQPPSDEHPSSEDITVERVVAADNLRLGFTIASSRDVVVLDSKAHDNGVSQGAHDPRRGMQIEPNMPEEVLQNIRVVNLETRGNAEGGVLLALDKLTSDSEAVDIVFEGFDSEGEEHGFGVAHGASDRAPAGVRGTVRVVEPRIHRAATHAIFVANNWVTATDVEIIKPVITEWNTDPTNEEWTDAAIIVSVLNETPLPVGNVRIVEPTITASGDASQHAYYLRAENQFDPDGVENVEFLDPVRLEGGRGFDVADGVVVDEEVTAPADWFARLLRLVERVLPVGGSRV